MWGRFPLRVRMFTLQMWAKTRIEIASQVIWRAQHPIHLIFIYEHSMTFHRTQILLCLKIIETASQVIPRAQHPIHVIFIYKHSMTFHRTQKFMKFIYEIIEIAFQQPRSSYWHDQRILTLSSRLLHNFSAHIAASTHASSFLFPHHSMSAENSLECEHL